MHILHGHGGMLATLLNLEVGLGMNAHVFIFDLVKLNHANCILNGHRNVLSFYLVNTRAPDWALLVDQPYQGLEYARPLYTVRWLSEQPGLRGQRKMNLFDHRYW